MTDSAESKNKDAGEGAPASIRFEYLKSSLFRIIHADGVIGGLTPRLDIQINFWSERFPIPQAVTHRVTADGKVGDEIRESRVSRGGIIREVETGIVIDLDTAKSFREWLTDRIGEVEKLVAERKAAENP